MGAASEYGAQLAAEQAAKDAALERAKKGLAAADTGTVSDVGGQLGDVVVTGQRDPTIQDTSIISPDVSVAGKKDGVVNVVGKREETSSLAPVTVTGKREPTIQDTDITLPETTVTGTPESDEFAQDGKPPVDEQGRYKPNLFIYGGVKPKGKSTLGSSLGTQAPFYPLAGTTGGLTSTRGAGELESKETGKKRQNVWNEESLRLKDALGI
jgi:hypothetical protein